MSKVSLPKEQEKSLVERMQRGSQKQKEECFTTLYLHYKPHIYRYLRAKVNAEEVADDLTATVFTKALEAIASYRWEGLPFSAWLYRIAHNALIDYYRKQSRSQSVSLEDAPPLRDKSPNPEELFFQWEMGETVKTLVSQLPPREKNIISLKFFEGYTNRRIAQLTGLTETNVGTIIYRIVKRMREELQD